jgi:hypothetical protein
MFHHSSYHMLSLLTLFKKKKSSIVVCNWIKHVSFPSAGIFFWRHGQVDWDLTVWDRVVNGSRSPALWLHRRGDVRKCHPDGQADLLVRPMAWVVASKFNCFIFPVDILAWFLWGHRWKAHLKTLPLALCQPRLSWHVFILQTSGISARAGVSKWV